MKNILLLLTCIIINLATISCRTTTPDVSSASSDKTWSEKVAKKLGYPVTDKDVEKCAPFFIRGSYGERFSHSGTTLDWLKIHLKFENGTEGNVQNLGAYTKGIDKIASGQTPPVEKVLISESKEEIKIPLIDNKGYTSEFAIFVDVKNGENVERWWIKSKPEDRNFSYKNDIENKTSGRTEGSTYKYYVGEKVSSIFWQVQKHGCK